METSVTVNLGYTLNVGNFQSIRIDLGCTDAVHRSNGETTSEAMERVYAFVEERLIEKVQEAKKELT